MKRQSLRCLTNDMHLHKSYIPWTSIQIFGTLLNRSLALSLVSLSLSSGPRQSVDVAFRKR